MRQVVFGVVCTLIMTFFLMIVMTIYGRNLRQTEAEHTLAEAVDTAMEDLLEERDYVTGSPDEFAADFLQLLISQLKSTSDVTVSILEADEKLGILSVEVVEKYKHPNGNTGAVSEVRTVILDKPQKEEKDYKKVSFYMGDDVLYKKYMLLKNSVCTVPLPPEKEGKTFRCWRFVKGAATGEAESMMVSGAGGNRNVIAANGEVYAVTEDTKLIAVYE